MKAIQLVKHGLGPDSFKTIEKEKPSPKKGEVLIRVQAFGLNYADVMARMGMYRDAPPLPSILGYDVVGIVESVGEGCDAAKTGQQVGAGTEFGGDSEYVTTREEAVVVLPVKLPLASAAALATQYATAYYCVFQLGNVQKGERVFIHAAAGGVGLALIQFCKLLECDIYATVSSDAKAELIRQSGVQHVIKGSYKDVLGELRQLDNKLDVVFDSVGGAAVKIGIKALRAGGRIITLGGAQMTAGKGFINLMRYGLSFGFYSPIQLLSQSKSIQGVNMLKLMRAHPHALANTLNGV